jgi:hypothetical protein
MKTTTLVIAVIVAMALGVSSCGSEGNRSENGNENISTGGDQVFGEFTELIAEYEDKIAENEEDQKKNTDLDKAFKLSQEEKQLKEEANIKVESFFKELKKPLTAMVIQQGDEESYKITELVLTEANFKNFKVKSNVEILDPAAIGRGIHIQMYNGDEPTNHWVNIGYSTDIDKTGNTWELTGGTYCSFLVGTTRFIAKPDSVYKASIK